MQFALDSFDSRMFLNNRDFKRSFLQLLSLCFQPRPTKRSDTYFNAFMVMYFQAKPLFNKVLCHFKIRLLNCLET